MKKYKGLAFVLAFTMLGSTLFACGGGSDSSSEASSVSSSSESSSQMTQEEMKEEMLVNPFWKSDTMYDETMILVAPTNDAGEITALPSANLLFNAEEIVEVKQYFHENNGNTITKFYEGTDFTYENGVITAKGTIGTNLFGQPVVNTTMPYVTDRQAKGIDSFPGLSNSTEMPSSEGSWNIPFTEGHQIVQMQISVTYRHNGEWTGTTPAYKGDVLSTTVNKLKNKQTTEILIFGDSVATGANSSSLLNIEPFLAPWFTLTANKLARHYGTKVNVTNKSVGGWTTNNGVSSYPTTGWINGQQASQVGLPKLLETDLANYTPDLVIFHFGLNDVTLGVNPQTYGMNMQKMIDAVRKRNPECDIIILGSIRANMQAKNQGKDLTDYITINNIVANAIYKDEHIVSLDVGAMQQEMLASGKKYLDMTGNNVNHPNDFLARLYAMNLLATLIEF